MDRWFERTTMCINAEGGFIETLDWSTCRSVFFESFGYELIDTPSPRLPLVLIVVFTTTFNWWWKLSSSHSVSPRHSFAKLWVITTTVWQSPDSHLCTRDPFRWVCKTADKHAQSHRKRTQSHLYRNTSRDFRTRDLRRKQRWWRWQWVLAESNL